MLVEDHDWPAATACTVLGASRSAYYAWQQRQPSRHTQRQKELTAWVRAVFWKHRRRYGARRIAAELADRSERCSRRLVRKIMKSEGLRTIQPKSFVPKTTDSQHGLGYSPNLILDTPEPSGVNNCG